MAFVCAILLSQQCLHEAVQVSTWLAWSHCIHSPIPDDALAFYRMLFDYGMANGLSVLLLRPFPAVVPYRLIGNQPVP